MSAAAPRFRAEIYSKDGVPYNQIHKRIFELDTGEYQSASRTLEIIVACFHADELDDQLTTAEIIRRIKERCGHWFSVSFIQKGLRILERLGIIGRVRRRGRRIISLVMHLLGKPPLDPPQEKRNTGETTTTKDASSSSIAPLPGGDGGASTPELPPDLARAVGRLPDLSRERLLGWVETFGLELVRLGLRWLDIWLCHPRAEKRPQGAYWLETALREWHRKLGRGLIAKGDIEAEIAAKVRRWGPKDAGPAPAPKMSDAAELPPGPLTAAEVADLVAACRQPDRNLAKYKRVELRLAVKNRQIADDVVATIPPELLERE